MYDNIYFCTSNKGKFAEVQRILGRKVSQLAYELKEYQHMDPVVVCEDKIKQAIDIVHGHIHDTLGGHSVESNYIILVEDTSVEIENMNQFPGAFIKFYLDAV